MMITKIKSNSFNNNIYTYILSTTIYCYLLLSTISDPLSDSK